MVTVVYIHGNGESSKSFDFLRSHIRGHREIMVNYDSKNGFDTNLAEMKAALGKHKNLFFVAHSLGGIYSLHLAEILKSRVVGAVTLSTPYAGCEAAEFLQYLYPESQLMRDIRPTSPPIMDSLLMNVSVPWTAIVSTGGYKPVMVAANDGIVTQVSMCARVDMRHVFVSNDHFDILLSKEVADMIQVAVDEAKMFATIKTATNQGRGFSVISVVEGTIANVPDVDGYLGQRSRASLSALAH